MVGILMRRAAKSTISSCARSTSINTRSATEDTVESYMIFPAGPARDAATESRHGVGGAAGGTESTDMKITLPVICIVASCGSLLAQTSPAPNTTITAVAGIKVGHHTLTE